MSVFEVSKVVGKMYLVDFSPHYANSHIFLCLFMLKCLLRVLKLTKEQINDKPHWIKSFFISS